jgi:hypothetical protein
MPRPFLLLTVDVEEDMPDWKITDPTTTANARALPAMQAMCEELGVAPTYLCDYPMVTQPSAAAVLTDLARGGRCEIGTHLHPWNTPPFPGIPGVDADERQLPYYLSQLGPERFARKLETLTAAIADLTGRRPVSFRAGRYGIDAATLAELPRQGYTTDTSVTPLVHHFADGGPDFRSAPLVPYFPSAADVCRRGELPIVEIPVSIGLTRRVPGFLRSAYVKIPAKTRIRGLLSRDFLGLVDFAWLYPARFDMELMSRAATTLAESGVPFLNVFLHSSELIPGASSLIRTEADAEGCRARLREILEFCIRRFDAVPLTLEEGGREARAWLAARASRATPA